MEDFLEQLPERLKQLRSNKKAIAALVLGAVLAVAGGPIWRGTAPESWIEVSPSTMQLGVGASAELSAAIRYKPRFWPRGQARSIGGTIQLISFPTAVDVTPTTLVTTSTVPEAKFRVRAVRAGREELVIAGTETPAEADTWRTESVRVFVGR